MVLADSHKASPTSRYSGYCYVYDYCSYGTVTLYCITFQIFLIVIISQYCSPTTPQRYTLWFRLFPFRSPLLRKSLDYFLFLGVLRCFSSPGSLSNCLEYVVFNNMGCPIRKSSDQCVCAASRSLSQLITSFVASQTQGIHRMLLVTFKFSDFLPILS